MPQSPKSASSSLFVKIGNLFKIAKSWLVDTPDRALEEAYRLALEIKAIEDQHFQGEQVSKDFCDYSNSVVDYFRTEVKKRLQSIDLRLNEFAGSRSVLGLRANNTNRSELSDREAMTIDKLEFVDLTVARYQPKKKLALVPVNSDRLSSKSPNPESTMADPDDFFGKRPKDKKKKSAQTVADETGVLPRSLLRTFNRIQQEIDPASEVAEEEVVKKYRNSRNKTAISVKFLLILIIIPLLTHQLTKNFVFTPIVEARFFTDNSEAIFINRDMQEEALHELKIYQDELEMKEYLGLTKESSPEKVKEQVKEKAEEIAEEYRLDSQNALENVFADVCSLIAFVVVLLTSQKEIAVLKSFIDGIVYGLSDSAKAFLIILFTDIFVGYHSPHGWEIILEGVAHHFGLPENRDFNFLFIATFPVILDTVLKYWIFRYLNRISPSAVATYRNMNE
jgi:hypothetical protein